MTKTNTQKPFLLLRLRACCIFGLSADMDAVRALVAEQKRLVEQVRCGFCDKHLASSKLCSRCKHVSYCQASCQHADWNQHKTVCKPLLSVTATLQKVQAYHSAGDWRGVLTCAWRLDEFILNYDDIDRNTILGVFITAHEYARNACTVSTEAQDHALSCFRFGHYVYVESWQCLSAPEPLKQSHQPLCGHPSRDAVVRHGHPSR